MTQNTAVLAYAVDPNGAEDRLWLLDLTDLSPEELPIDVSDPKCSSVRLYHPQRLPDGRLGFVHACLSPDGAEGDKFGLVAFDLETQSETVLADLGQIADSFSFASDMRRAVVASGSQICEGIFLVTPTGTERIDAEGPGGDHTFNLDASPSLSDNGDCPNDPIATLPAWSPLGEAIAFFASPEAIGRRGQERLDQPFNLYGLDLAEPRATIVLEDIQNPGSLAWTTDGRSLLFSGESNGARGVWMVDMETRTLELITDAPARSPSWAPSGERRLLALEDTGRMINGAPEARLIELVIPPNNEQR